MILADTSAWIEFLRGTGSKVDRRFDALLSEPGALATTDPVVMEVLAGSLDDFHHSRLKRLLAGCERLPVQGPLDYEAAASLYRVCRAKGTTVRALVDCLIATVAIRHDVPLLHADQDFGAIARHAPLRIA